MLRERCTWPKYNMHDGVTKTVEIKAGDAWLKAHVPAMLAGGAKVIVTWDEATRTNEHVATIAVGGTAKSGAEAADAYTHYSLLAGLEDSFGVPRLTAGKRLAWRVSRAPQATAHQVVAATGEDDRRARSARRCSGRPAAPPPPSTHGRLRDRTGTPNTETSGTSLGSRCPPSAASE
jgi:hypothetical protein